MKYITLKKLTRNKRILISASIGITLLLVSLIVYISSNRFIQQQVERRIRDVMLEAKALHKYIQEDMHPIMYQLKQEDRMPNDFYAPEILSSSYITRKIFQHFNDERRKLSLPEIAYKMASENPRNPENKANSFEASLIELFSKDSTRDEYAQVINENGQQYMVYARPFLKVNQRCLKCHGNQEDAPKELRDYYHWEGGFNKQIGEIPAIEIVKTPIVAEFRAISNILIIIGLSLILATVLVFVNIKLRNLNTVYSNELLQVEEKYHRLFNNTSDAILIHRLNGSIVEVNDVASDYLGYSRKQLLSMSPSDLDDETNAKRIEERIATIINKGHFKFETVHIRKDGKRIPCEVNSTIINFNDERAILSSLRDISDRKIHEQEILKAKEKAEESDKLKSAFLANMSHEIRTPMNGIVGFSQLLGLNDTPEKREKYIHNINSCSNQLMTIISDIIDISKIEAQQIEISIQKFQVKAFLEHIYEEILIQQKLRKKEQIKIQLNIDATLTEIESDDNRLRQVICNLACNAIKFTDKGSVEIGAKKLSEDTLQFYVKDTGIGIPEEFHQDIFERFRQVENGNSRNYGGTGLGLAISKSFISILGGEIQLESVPQKGSTFYISLPFEPPAGLANRNS